MKLNEIISRCAKYERPAQNHLYEQYAPLFKSIALRYIKDDAVAEDILVKAFFKIFTSINSFKKKGSFEGWMKRILINECLMEIRKTKNMALTVPISDSEVDWQVHTGDHLEYMDIIALLDELPTGYRTVFNLYVIEGYKHREIAEMLEISINTSKSQLILAKRRLQKLIKKKWSSRTA